MVRVVPEPGTQHRQGRVRSFDLKQGVAIARNRDRIVRKAPYRLVGIGDQGRVVAQGLMGELPGPIRIALAYCLGQTPEAAGQVVAVTGALVVLAVSFDQTIQRAAGLVQTLTADPVHDLIGFRRHRRAFYDLTASLLGFLEGHRYRRFQTGAGVFVQTAIAVVEPLVQGLAELPAERSGGQGLQGTKVLDLVVQGVGTGTPAGQPLGEVDQAAEQGRCRGSRRRPARATRPCASGVWPSRRDNRSQKDSSARSGWTVARVVNKASSGVAGPPTLEGRQPAVIGSRALVHPAPAFGQAEQIDRPQGLSQGLRVAPGHLDLAPARFEPAQQDPIERLLRMTRSCPSATEGGRVLQVPKCARPVNAPSSASDGLSRKRASQRPAASCGAL